MHRLYAACYLKFSNGFKLFLLQSFWGYLEDGRTLCRSEEKTCTLFFFRRYRSTLCKNPLIEEGLYFFAIFLSGTKHKPCSSSAEISSIYLSCPSLESDSLNNFTSYEVFCFVLVFSCYSLNDFFVFWELYKPVARHMHIDVRLAAFFFVRKVNRARREMTSSIWKIRHYCPGCSFAWIFYEWSSDTWYCNKRWY